MLKSLARRFAGTALLFAAVVSAGTSLVLLVSSCLGYLPYSDRPGPGWWGRVHWPLWSEFVTYIGFAPWFAYFCLFFGFGLFGLCLVLGIASTPRWLNRLVGAVIAAPAAGLAVASAGWYMALAAIGPDAAIVFGLLYGVFLFPCFIESRPATDARVGADHSRLLRDGPVLLLDHFSVPPTRAPAAYQLRPCACHSGREGGDFYFIRRIGDCYRTGGHEPPGKRSRRHWRWGRRFWSKRTTNRPGTDRT